MLYPLTHVLFQRDKLKQHANLNLINLRNSKSESNDYPRHKFHLKKHYY